MDWISSRIEISSPWLSPYFSRMPAKLAEIIEIPYLQCPRHQRIANSTGRRLRPESVVMLASVRSCWQAVCRKIDEQPESGHPTPKVRLDMVMLLITNRLSMKSSLPSND